MEIHGKSMENRWEFDARALFRATSVPQDVEEDEEDEAEKTQIELAVPKKLMVLPKNVLVDLLKPKKELDSA